MGWKALTLHKRNYRRTHCEIYGEASTRKLHSIPNAVSGSGRHDTNKSIRRCHPYARKSVSQAIRSKMQLTLHATRPTPHGASRLMQAMSAWSVKIRRAPSRRCGDARVYGHTTMAMHALSTSPHAPCVSWPVRRFFTAVSPSARELTASRRIASADSNSPGERGPYR